MQRQQTSSSQHVTHVTLLCNVSLLKQQLLGTYFPLQVTGQDKDGALCCFKIFIVAKFSLTCARPHLHLKSTHISV